MVTKESLRGWFLRDGYLWDWIVAIIFIIFNRVVPNAISPITRDYTPGDPTLSYPLKANTVGTPLFYSLAFAFPGAVFITTAALHASFADGHHALLSLAEGYALALGWKQWMNKVGRLRPSWLDTVAQYGIDSPQAADAHEAYPSGHATYMFVSTTLLACWLMGKMRVLAQPSQALFLKLLVCLSPMWLATWVAMTRLADYKHDFSDVNAGCFIGIATGLIGYFLNYPSLFSLHCHLPKLRSRLSALRPDPAPGSGVCLEPEQASLSESLLLTPA